MATSRSRLSVRILCSLGVRGVAFEKRICRQATVTMMPARPNRKNHLWHLQILRKVLVTTPRTSRNTKVRASRLRGFSAEQG